MRDESWLIPHPLFVPVFLIFLKVGLADFAEQNISPDAGAAPAGMGVKGKIMALHMP